MAGNNSLLKTERNEALCKHELLFDIYLLVEC